MTRQPHSASTLRWLIVGACLLLLSACAHRGPLTQVDNFQRYQARLSAVEDWQLRGKIIIRAGDDAEKARVSWRNQGPSYRIRLSGTLGMGTTYIVGDPKQVRLEQSGEPPVIASSPEQLIYEQLGQHIPVSDLYYWVRGITAPQKPIKHRQLTPTGTLQQLEQAGWTLQYSDYHPVDQWNLPGRIIASRDDIELTITIDLWQLATTP